MSDTAPLTDARILVLLEVVEAHERDRRPLRLNDLGGPPQRVEAEVRWLSEERLALFGPLDDDAGPGSLPALTAHGRGTLALMRGEASAPSQGAE